jgi:hypothetical protein
MGTGVKPTRAMRSRVLTINELGIRGDTVSLAMSRAWQVVGTGAGRRGVRNGAATQLAPRAVTDAPAMIVRNTLRDRVVINCAIATNFAEETAHGDVWLWLFTEGWSSGVVGTGLGVPRGSCCGGDAVEG